MSGRYRLVQECDGQRLYFNFETKQFDDCPEDDCPESENRSVSLTTIDEFTTLFRNEREMINLIRDSGFEPEESEMFITYNLMGERRLDPVFDDPYLHEVASDITLCHDGKVDTRQKPISDKLSDIFEFLQVPGNSLLRIVNDRAERKSPRSLTKESTDFLNETAVTADKVNGVYWFERFKRQFSSYKEFRALYLTYLPIEKRIQAHRGNQYSIGSKND